MRNAFLICGLGYGDEAKGATTDFICRTRDVKLVVRYNGGPQAGHNVVTPDGLHHTFSQFGSGSFVPGVRTHLSRFMLVNPVHMMNEALHLHSLGVTDILYRTTVDPKCLIVTPFQKSVNRILGRNQQNTCGQGVGRTREDHCKHGPKVLFAGDLEDKVKMKEKLIFIQKISQEAVAGYGVFARKMCANEFELLHDPDAGDTMAKFYSECPMQVAELEINSSENILFEGAQGVLLDETHGEVGYNTWTNTTFENAERILREAGWKGKTTKIGIVRTYMTRHGAGPLPTEDSTLDFPELHNPDDGYQGKFRRGHFDSQLIRYAIKVCGGVDGVALNHCDYIERVDGLKDLKVVIRGFGPSANERSWVGAANKKS